jgi:hypothetical protein
MNYEQRNKRRYEQQQENEQEKPKDEKHIPARINIKTIEMEGTFKSKLITSVKLCNMINKIMRGVSPDFDGSRIQVQGSNVVCELFFCENPHIQPKEGQIQVIERRDNLYNNKTRDAASIIDRYNRRNRVSTQYELTEEGKEAFAEFVPSYFVINREKGIVDWSRASSEDCEVAYNGRNKVYVKIQFDLQKFLRKVYGKSAGDGTDYIYEIAVLRPLDALKIGGGNIVSTKWLMNILQVDDANVRSTYEESGFSPLQNTLNIIR